MRRFAELLERLAFTPARNGKLTLLIDYLAATPDPDRGWGLAAITRDLTLDAVKPAMLRAITVARVDAELFALSYDFVGDLAETIALIWPTPPGPPDDPPLAEVVGRLRAASRREAPQVVERLLDRLDASGRFALLKLVTGGLRVGVSARLAKQALAALGGRDVIEIEELWHGLVPPYAGLFAWLAGGGPRPDAAAGTPFRPVMLAHALTEPDLAGLDPADYLAEWKWDGIRVQAAADAHGRRLFSRTGDDISGAFPDLLDALDFDAALDGELLVRRDDGSIASFSDLQQRLNRKTVTAAQLRQYPAHLRAYDLLQSGADRPPPAALRRAPRRARGPRHPARPGPLRPLAAPALRQLGRADRLPRSTARPGDRGRDAQAPRQPLRPRPAQGPLVEVEARSAHHRRGADVRPARPRQALGLLFRLYLRGLDRGRHADPGRQGLLRLHRRGAGPDRPLRARQHHRPLRPGARRPRRPRPRPGARGRLRGPGPLSPPPLRPGDALPAHQPPALGQAAVRGRHPGDAGGAACPRSEPATVLRCRAGARRYLRRRPPGRVLRPDDLRTRRCHRSPP